MADRSVIEDLLRALPAAERRMFFEKQVFGEKLTTILRRVRPVDSF